MFLLKIQKIFIYDVLLLFWFFETFSEQHFETLSEINNLMSIRTISIFQHSQAARAYMIGRTDFPSNNENVQKRKVENC